MDDPSRSGRPALLALGTLHRRRALLAHRTLSGRRGRSVPRLAFSVGESGDIRMFDRVTGQLIRQIPPEARIRMAAQIADILERFSA